MSTGDEFQNKIEDDLYEKSEEPSDSKYQSFLGNAVLTVFAVAIIFCIVVGCVALWRAVF